MPIYHINAGQPDMIPKFDVEADRYEEEGSFTKFYDTEGKEVTALRTDTVFSMEVT
ncbi:hypothetical protein [Gordonia sp. (in: high G+C Gram-positive bacteria)]|uniref:hypothetical protein n=1 Tax=Gordonia sp. (in: high G+C Gram-positive bacteria) TaxID=84139 RepID=UPI00333F6042